MSVLQTYESQTYRRRKARGLCPQCRQRPSPGYVYCEACRQGMQAYHAAHDTALLLAPHIAGPALLCCGRWHPIVQTPLRVLCCNTVYFAEKAERCLTPPSP